MEKKEIKHTPTPWEVDGYSINGKINGEKVQLALLSRTSYCGNLTEKEKIMDKAIREFEKGDAEFIVRAVNAHAELVEACKKVGDYCHRLHFQDVQLSFRECGQVGCMEIKKAIAKAEGKG